MDLNKHMWTPPPGYADFWENVDIGAPEDCWLYTGRASKGTSGHARITYRGQRIYAHRLAWIAAGYGIADGQIVMHGCDVPACVNPHEGHLHVGTVQQNNAERDARGRRNPPTGSAHWSALLSERDIGAVRSLRSDRVPVKLIAVAYEVSPATIYNLLAGTHYPAAA
jgi:hypothetical protein